MEVETTNTQRPYFELEVTPDGTAIIRHINGDSEVNHSKQSAPKAINEVTKTAKAKLPKLAENYHSDADIAGVAFDTDLDTLDFDSLLLELQSLIDRRAIVGLELVNDGDPVHTQLIQYWQGDLMLAFERKLAGQIVKSLMQSMSQYPYTNEVKLNLAGVPHYMINWINEDIINLGYDVSHKHDQ